jgi:hypothetical protein
VRGRLGRPSEAEHALVPRLTGQPIGLLASIARAFSRRLDGSAVNAFARFDGHGERIKARRATGRRSSICWGLGWCRHTGAGRSVDPPKCRATGPCFQCASKFWKHKRLWKLLI